MSDQPKVEAGLSTYVGFGLVVATAVGALVAALQGNDTATVTAGASGVLLALGTIGGRMAQALAIAKRVAVVAEPFVEALARYGDPEVEDVPSDDLPTDEEEFASPPPSPPVQPSQDPAAA